MPTGIAEAFVDRAAIDWAALLRRARASADRTLLENLSFLDSIRPSRSASRVPAEAFSWPVSFARVVFALAAVQTACGIAVLALAASRGQPAVYRTSPLILALAFTAGSLLLGVAASADRRRLFLLTTFVCAASAFARAALNGLPVGALGPVEGIFRGLFPEAFAPATLWHFAVSFPRVRRFNAFDVVARRVAAASWLLGLVLFGANVAAAYRLPENGPMAFLERDHSGNVFWYVFVVAVAPAIGTIFMRARHAPAAERRKVARFAVALTVGTAPFLIAGLARLILPGIDDWFRRADPAERRWLDWLIVGGLAAMPILASAAVLADRPFGSESVRWYPSRERLARAVLTAAVSAPFAVFVLALYRLRHLAIVDLLSTWRGWLLLACAAAGCLLLVARPKLRRIVRHGSMKRAADHEERLAAALERVRVARGEREVGSVLARELQKGLRVSNVRMLLPAPGGIFVETSEGTGSLGPETALVVVLQEMTGPLVLSSRSARALLPEKDREWVAENEVELAVPLKQRDGTLAAIILIGSRRGARSFDRQDRWFVSALTSAAAAAWAGEVASTVTEANALRGGAEAEGDAAFECPRCGWVAASTPLPCGCGRGAVLASLPHRLAGKFIVERRLGAGGMGVVYLARDMTLHRDVALKTLPDLRDGTVTRMQDEARAMASLNHEGLATLYGLERWHRTPVLIVEYFPEGTLARRLADGPLTASAAVAIGIRLAQALAYMHAKGVLHRDLKPSNIGLTTSGTPKLLDFGLTVRSAPDVPALGGTPAYLPPEAYAGVPPDPAFDLWALSIVLVEAITGRRPVVTGRRSSARRRFSRVDFAGLHSPILTAFFERALAVSPEMRFPNALEFQLALEELAHALR